ncbi:hypothetical protein VU08_05750 [Desulfobulbus sp. F5]|nr:hypothetical protein [Desulfobulbus sp. F5]
MIVSLPEIRHDLSGFQALTNLWAETKDCFFENIEIKLDGASWLDADMCAAFGAILHNLSGPNTVKLTGIRPNVESILSKNGFLSHYGRKRIQDRWGTTIPYQRFDIKDERYFAKYIEQEFLHRTELPDMSLGLMKKFRESICEIFGNSVLHSQTKLGIFSCGQFFPNRNRLDFSVADLGIGIRRNIKDSLGLELSPEQAINWATQKGNTTKRAPLPGGLGLKLLGEFIDLNGGCIQIVSDAGYWRRQNRKTDMTLLRNPFLGTVVSIEINTADTNSYVLTSELNAADIF